jgi:hypothetical protein
MRSRQGLPDLRLVHERQRLRAKEAAENKQLTQSHAIRELDKLQQAYFSEVMELVCEAVHYLALVYVMLVL